MKQETSQYSPSIIKRKQLIAIRSLNKTSKDQKNSRVFQSQKKTSIEKSTITHNTISQIIENNQIPKIINVALNTQIQLIPINKKIRDNESIKTIIYPSYDKNKYEKYEIKIKQIYKKQKHSIRLLSRMKYHFIREKLPMKKFIKIQKMSLSNSTPFVKTSLTKSMFTKHLSMNTKPIAHYQFQSTQEQHQHQQKKTKKSRKSSQHRNYSSHLSARKLIQICEQNLIIQKQPSKKKCLDDFQVRRPLARKDYFVFGLSDRMSSQNKIQYFRDLLWKINFSNSLFVHTPDQIITLYKAYIGPGNNYHLVKGILKRRFWWTIIEKPETRQEWESINVLWMQLKNNHFYQFQMKSSQLILYLNHQNTIEVDSSQPQTAINKNMQDDHHKKLFSKTDLINWNKHTSKNQKSQERIHQHTYVKRLSLLNNKNIKIIENSAKLKVHNHLQSNFFIGNKKALFYNMRRYLSLKNIDPFTVLPITFHISRGVEDNEFKRFKKYFDEIEQSKNAHGIRNIWIVKPGENTNRGNGITVAYSLDDIYVRLRGKEKNNDGKLRTFIIQKYIEKPLLYYRRKFDIRHYMLITCINGCFKGYWYEEGYIRTSSTEFTTKYSKDPFVHLTNDAIQKNSVNYGRYEKGNKLSYWDFQRYLQNTYKKEKVNFFVDILPKMKEMGTEAVRATYGFLDERRLQSNFELLGLDFMVDEQFKPWLIEVNTNPCLELSCSLLSKIIPQLIENVFRICIDPLFPPPQCWQAGRKFYFGESPLSENKFEIIFDEYDDGKQIEKLYKGEYKLDEKMGKIEEDDEVFEDDGVEDWESAK